MKKRIKKKKKKQAKKRRKRYKRAERKSHRSTEIHILFLFIRCKNSYEDRNYKVPHFCINILSDGNLVERNILVLRSRSFSSFFIFFISSWKSNSCLPFSFCRCICGDVCAFKKLSFAVVMFGSFHFNGI